MIVLLTHGTVLFRIRNYHTIWQLISRNRVKSHNTLAEKFATLFIRPSGERATVLLREERRRSIVQSTFSSSSP